MRSKTIVLVVLCALSVSVMAQQQVRGTWHGALQLNAMKLNLVLHIDNDSLCTLDSPDQGAKGIAGTIKELTEEKIHAVFPMLMAEYSAEMKDGTLTGTFKQRGFTLPLTMERGDLIRQRPQTPQPPFPYETREVTFSHDSITLAGTLTRPVFDKGERSKEKREMPVLLLVTGSGLQDRDETIFDHKPFAVIADYLARHGIATLRYDDRGFGQSTGDPSQCTTADFAVDAAAGIAFLRSLKASPMGGGSKGAPLFSKVGILGHSEGGSIAFMLGAQQLPDFIVALAAPGIKGDTLLVEQTNALLELSGKPANMTLRTMRILMSMEQQNAWYQYFMEYDPVQDIAATRCPVLALNGSLDKQVLPESNLTAIRNLLKLNEWTEDSLPFREGLGVGFTKLYPNLNHLFQHATTGAAAEYGTIEETISEEVLQDIVEWMKRCLK